MISRQHFSRFSSFHINWRISFYVLSDQNGKGLNSQHVTLSFVGVPSYNTLPRVWCLNGLGVCSPSLSSSPLSILSVHDNWWHADWVVCVCVCVCDLRRDLRTKPKIRAISYHVTRPRRQVILLVIGSTYCLLALPNYDCCSLWSVWLNAFRFTIFAWTLSDISAKDDQRFWLNTLKNVGLSRARALDQCWCWWC